VGTSPNRMLTVIDAIDLQHGGCLKGGIARASIWFNTER
jgi:hypothetical protein